MSDLSSCGSSTGPGKPIPPRAVEAVSFEPPFPGNWTITPRSGTCNLCGLHHRVDGSCVDVLKDANLDLTSKNSRLEDRITTLTDEKTNLEWKVTALTDEKMRLESRVSELITDLRDLRSKCSGETVMKDTCHEQILQGWKDVCTTLQTACSDYKEVIKIYQGLLAEHLACKMPGPGDEK